MIINTLSCSISYLDSRSVKTVLHSPHSVNPGHTVTHTVTHQGNTVTHTVTHTVGGVHHAGGGTSGTTVTHTTHGVHHHPDYEYGHPTGAVTVMNPGISTFGHKR